MTTNPVTPLNRERCRRIVKLAAESVDARSVKAWLIQDEHGKHERYAADLLAKVAALPPEKTAGRTETSIDEELASYVALAALEATMAHEKKRRNR